MIRDQEAPRPDGAPAIRMGSVSPPRPWPGRRGPVQGGRCSEPVGRHWPPVHHRGTICRERLAPHRKPMSEKEVIGSPIATRYEYQIRAQGGMVAGKIPGLTTLRPASRAVHHRRALLARVRGQAQAQDFSAASGPRRGGCAPRRGATGGGRTDTQAPHGRGSARVQGQTDVLLPDFPARRGFTGFTLRFQAGRAHRPAQAGARLTDRRPGVRTPGRDTPPPGAMRNLRVPEDAHSGDW